MMTQATTLYKTPAGQQAMVTIYEAVLADWPVPAEMYTLDTRHGETFVISGGDPGRPALVLLHGAGSNSATWAGDVNCYQPYFRWHAVDLIGEAGKSAPNRPPLEGPAYTEWLEDVLDGLGVPQASLVGLSQGGWIALKFAITHPERVSRLVLMTPGGVTPDQGSFLLQVMFYSLLGRWGVERIRNLVMRDTPLTPEADEFFRLSMKEFKARMVVLPIFSDDELRRLEMPVLFLGGERDALRDVGKIAARLEGLLPDLTAKIYPGAGHALVGTGEDVVQWCLRYPERSQVGA